MKYSKVSCCEVEPRMVRQHLDHSGDAVTRAPFIQPFVSHKVVCGVRGEGESSSSNLSEADNGNKFDDMAALYA